MSTDAVSDKRSDEVDAPRTSPWWDEPSGRPEPTPVLTVLRRSMRTHARRWRIAWYAAASVVVVVLATVLVWPSRPGPTEQVVRDFLDAVHRGDVRAAERLATAPVDHVDSSFLRRGVVRQRWHVDSVRSTTAIDAYSSDDTVVATIAVPGERTVRQSFTVTRDMRLDDDSEDTRFGPWRLEDPYVYVSFGSFPLDYVDVNGHRVRRADRDVPATGTYALFPGRYRFFASAPSAVTHSAKPLLLLPGGYEVRQYGDEPAADDVSGVITVPPMTLTDAAQRRAQRAVRRYLADCAAGATTLVPTRCPFGTDYVEQPANHDNALLDSDAPSVKWSVSRDPVVTVLPTTGTYQVVDRRPGVMTVTATGTSEVTGFHGTISARCPVLGGTLRADVTDDGGVRILPFDGKNAQNSYSGHGC